MAISGMTNQSGSDHNSSREVVIERDGQEPLRGHAWVSDGVLTVTALDGRQLSTVARRGPEDDLAARMMLQEIDAGPLVRTIGP
jgi:hypothetical protein